MSLNILCIDDDPAFLLSTKIVLKKKYRVFTAPAWENAQDILKTQGINLLFLDVNLGETNGIALIKKIRKEFPNLDVVMLSGLRDPNMIVAAIHEGAVDYVCKPCAAEELLAVVEKNLKNRNVQDRLEALVQDMNASVTGHSFVGKAARFVEVLEHAKRLKGYSASVLIEGESGTGKEILARYINKIEEDPRRPFIAVNCAAIPENLLESELFGYEQGAFTGASRRKIGKFELANGGDMFLDEINSLRPELQAKLLRILQEKEFYRLGGNEPIQVKFRVIAASNVDLNEEVKNNHFRQDLLYRLRVVSLTMPPLRERIEDIEELAAFFLKKHTQGKHKTFAPEVIGFFKHYAWPGNIRELENIIQSLIIMSAADEIVLTDLPAWLKNSPAQPVAPGAADAGPWPELKFDRIQQSLKNVMADVERAYIRKVISSLNGNVTEAARLLKVSRSKVYYTIKGTDVM